MNFWKFIERKVKSGSKVALLYVVQSIGSSPGRQGFRMAVADDGDMTGSIGGGIMEHKFVELVRHQFSKEDFTITFKHQIHHKKSPVDQSGMICSGEQTVVIYHLSNSKELLYNIVENKDGVLELTPTKVEFHKNEKQAEQFSYKFQDENNWIYREQLYFEPILHLIGGGHVGLAFSELMHFLGYTIYLYDDRPDLNTMSENNFAHHKTIVDYNKIGDLIPSDPNAVVVIMSFGYRGDKIVLEQLIQKDFGYIGMMGSKAKVKQLFKAMKEEGHTQILLDKIHAPIGLAIHSKTPKEIAVSIAAEIIRTKNKTT